MNNAAIIDILDRLEERLTPELWIKGPFSVLINEQTLSGCLVTHTNDILHSMHPNGSVLPSGIFLDKLHAVVQALTDELPPEYGGSLVNFNDAPTTTLEDVKLLVKKARHTLEEAL